MNGGRSVTTGNPIALMHAEQRPLAHGLVADVDVGMIVRSEGVAFVMIQPVAIGGHARHEDVADQASVEASRRGFDLQPRWCRAPSRRRCRRRHRTCDRQRGLPERFADRCGPPRYSRTFLPEVVRRPCDAAIVTSCPALSSSATRLRPMNRVPPITSTRMRLPAD